MTIAPPAKSHDPHPPTPPHKGEGSAPFARRDQMADTVMARQGSAFVSELESKNLHPLWDRYQRITPISAAAAGRAVHLALARCRAAAAALGPSSVDQ